MKLLSIVPLNGHVGIVRTGGAIVSKRRNLPFFLEVL